MKTARNIDVLFVARLWSDRSRPGRKPQVLMSRALDCRSKKIRTAIYIRGALDGVKHFALWPLAQAAESCFGTDQWPGDLSVPQAWIEFDVEDIEKATAELNRRVTNYWLR